VDPFRRRLAGDALQQGALGVERRHGDRPPPQLRLDRAGQGDGESWYGQVQDVPVHVRYLGNVLIYKDFDFWCRDTI